MTVGFFVFGLYLVVLKRYSFNGSLAGCDEAGRGCLAGPVFAAAVILPKSFEHPLLNDSKKLSEKHRNTLRTIIEKESIAWAVSQLSPQEIDEYNILWSSFHAMHKALDKLQTRPDKIIVDGNRFIPYKDIAFECVIKGDGKYLSIAAASVLAKTHRDAYMAKLSNQHPAYGWDQNKGYPTLAHRQAIHQFGPTLHHRQSFKLTNDQLKLDL